MTTTETTWTDVRAAMLRKGDVTPAGAITDIEFFGDLLRVAFDTEDGRSFTRTFDDLVSVQRVRHLNLSGVCQSDDRRDHARCAGRFASTTVDPTVRLRCECECHKR